MSRIRRMISGTSVGSVVSISRSGHPPSTGSETSSFHSSSAERIESKCPAWGILLGSGSAGERGPGRRGRRPPQPDRADGRARRPPANGRSCSRSRPRTGTRPQRRAWRPRQRAQLPRWIDVGNGQHRHERVLDRVLRYQRQPQLACQRRRERRLPTRRRPRHHDEQPPRTLHGPNAGHNRGRPPAPAINRRLGAFAIAWFVSAPDPGGGRAG